MIYADLNGKGHVPEDLLTSNCLGLLDLLPHHCLIDFIERAESSSGTQLRIGTRAKSRIVVDFWPYLPGGGIPDAMLTIDRGGSESFKIILEAKHGASQTGDQLSSYLRAAYHRFRDRFALVYLTHHRSIPKAECERSENIAAVPARIYWLSWHTLFSWAHDELLAYPYRPYSERKILELLIYYLTEKGYLKFVGFGRFPKGFVPTDYRRLYKDLANSRTVCQPGWSGQYGYRYDWRGVTWLSLWEYTSTRQGWQNG